MLLVSCVGQRTQHKSCMGHTTTDNLHAVLACMLRSCTCWLRYLSLSQPGANLLVVARWELNVCSSLALAIMEVCGIKWNDCAGRHSTIVNKDVEVTCQAVDCLCVH